ncbi:MAG: hypothetical protein J6S14_20815 [Clostridia bacterium]|nr:hypothetical protein [Clostridia bacterium]
MFVNLIVMSGKHVPQAKAEVEMVRGQPVEGGAFIVNKPKNYDGVNAIFEPKAVESDMIAIGELYNKEPTFVGERYATTEVTGADTLAEGDALTVADNKWVAGEGEWKFGGKYTAHAYGVDMWIVEKVPAQA